MGPNFYNGSYFFPADSITDPVLSIIIVVIIFGVLILSAVIADIKQAVVLSHLYLLWHLCCLRHVLMLICNVQ